MALVVIAGTASCPRYAQAEFLAGVLSKKLPHFKVRRLLIEECNWDRWSWNVCKENDWIRVKCPLVWRELGMAGGRPALIGSLSEFLEFCHEYYGITSILTPEEKQMLADENMKFNERDKIKRELPYLPRKVFICGAPPRVLPILIAELLNLKCLGTEKGCVIHLYDTSKKKYILEHIKKDSTLMGVGTGNDCKIVESVREGLSDCDVFLLFNAFTRKEETNIENIFKKNYTSMVKLAKVIDKNAPQDCRIILAGPEEAPLCFNATVLINASQTITRKNLVVVTAYLGTEVLPVIAKLTGTNISDMAAPAVWGFVGLNHYVDFDNMIYMGTYFVPNKRALKRIPNSTLPQGTLITELRKFIYLIETIHHVPAHIEKFKNFLKDSSGELPELPKVKAIVNLLKLWYSKEYDGEVISLGIISDGTFGIPSGIAFSQPVVLDLDEWKPYAKYPRPDKSKCNLDNFINTAIYTLFQYAINVIFHYCPLWAYVDSEQIEAEEKEKETLQYKYPEFPDPFKDIDAGRNKNEIGVARAMLKIELQWKIDEENIVPSVFTDLLDRYLRRTSSTTLRLSFHSEESLRRREAIINEKTVRNILQEFVMSIGEEGEEEVEEEGEDEEEKKVSEGEESQG